MMANVVPRGLVGPRGRAGLEARPAGCQGGQGVARELLVGRVLRVLLAGLTQVGLTQVGLAPVGLAQVGLALVFRRREAQELPQVGPVRPRLVPARESGPRPVERRSSRKELVDWGWKTEALRPAECAGDELLRGRNL